MADNGLILVSIFYCTVISKPRYYQRCYTLLTLVLNKIANIIYSLPNDARFFYNFFFLFLLFSCSCTKLVDGQTFGPNIAHLRIKDAGEIRLGPNALRVRGLQQLESITIVDTHIVELDRTAFNGITYLFAVNLTRNGLREIHPNTFQNNTQLSLLTISGNPLMQDATKHYLLHAPSVTDFVFSNNGIEKLKRTAFSKMRSLTYLNLRGNRLREIDGKILNGLDSLVEMDLSENLLTDIPYELFKDTPVQTLNIAGKRNGFAYW